MPLNYEIRVRGRVDDHLVGELGFPHASHPSRPSCSAGAPDDLQDMLAQLQDLGSSSSRSGSFPRRIVPQPRIPA